jgi:hypothetical protein
MSFSLHGSPPFLVGTAIEDLGLSLYTGNSKLSIIGSCYICRMNCVNWRSNCTALIMLIHSPAGRIVILSLLQGELQNKLVGSCSGIKQISLGGLASNLLNIVCPTSLQRNYTDMVQTKHYHPSTALNHLTHPLPRRSTIIVTI